MTKGPLMFDLEQVPDHTPQTAPPVEGGDRPSGQAMQTLGLLAARPRSGLGRLFWTVAGALVTFLLSVAIWTYVRGLLLSYPWLGWTALGLFAALGLVLLAIAVREWRGFRRLARLDGYRRRADSALDGADLTAARRLSRDLSDFYAGRDGLADPRARLGAQIDDQFDPAAVFHVTETTLMAPLDGAARAEVAAAARQVATVTALVPLALADVLAALTANLRMIRRVAEIYGGRSGTLGNWRLTRSVLAHLVATGAVAMGDDMLDSFIGGGILSKVSRRFGEGLVNGALTARVGVAAMEVCRPLPFTKQTRPGVRKLVQQALGGLVPGQGG